jgi:hypothetical protein
MYGGASMVRPRLAISLVAEFFSPVVGLDPSTRIVPVGRGFAATGR